MAYVVKQLSELYAEDTTDMPTSDVIGRFLSNAESEGFRLVGIVPDHQEWDDEGQPIGKVGAVLILHRDGQAG